MLTHNLTIKNLFLHMILYHHRKYIVFKRKTNNLPDETIPNGQIFYGFR